MLTREDSTIDAPTTKGEAMNKVQWNEVLLGVVVLAPLVILVCVGLLMR